MARAGKNGYYGSLVPMVRDAFIVSELVRIDCQGLERKDYKKLGCKLRVKPDTYSWYWIFIVVLPFTFV